MLSLDHISSPRPLVAYPPLFSFQLGADSTDMAPTIAANKALWRSLRNLKWINPKVAEEECMPVEDLYPRLPTTTFYPQVPGSSESSFSEKTEFHPVILEFQRVIEDDPVLFMGFSLMFDQIPSTSKFEKTPNGLPQARNYKEMLRRFNEIIAQAPPFEDTKFAGLPVNAVLNWPMATPAGLAVLTSDKVNAQFKKMFDVWSAFLVSPASRHVLSTDEDGWFGPKARKAMPDFDETFVCDPRAEHHGYASWDDFFTRRFRPGLRPVASPTDTSVITSPCESKIYRIAPDAKALDQFWLKGQPYSLRHMLNNDPLADLFAGGTVYQAYLSALSYHRWHSPVDGTIRRWELIPGTYYTQCPEMGFPNPDPIASCGSQAYITTTAARALVFIDADNADIGLMCFIAVGMAEVSTCEVLVQPGQRVKRGDELGTFHFGGSTSCMIFRPQTNLEFAQGVKEDTSIKLNTAIARVRSA